MKIRRASKTDVDDCFNVLKSDEDTYWRKEDLKVSAEDGRVIFLVAEENGRVMGYIQGFILPTKRTEALIHETRVRKQERGKGVGIRLVDAFCEEAFERGADVVLAEIEPDLLSFYRDSCGFKERGKWLEVGKKKE
jgi:ribosomal protein S18 acetylase RimI-like enzyme